MKLTILSQVVKLNSAYIFILYSMNQLAPNIF